MIPDRSITSIEVTPRRAFRLPDGREASYTLASGVHALWPIRYVLVVVRPDSAIDAMAPEMAEHILGELRAETRRLHGPLGTLRLYIGQAVRMQDWNGADVLASSVWTEDERDIEPPYAPGHRVYFDAIPDPEVEIQEQLSRAALALGGLRDPTTRP